MPNSIDKPKKHARAAPGTKGELSLRTLGVLDRLLCGLDDLFLIMSLPPNTTILKAISLLEKQRAENRELTLLFKKDEAYRRRAYNMLHRLRKDGLINDTGAKIAITAKGREKLRQLLQRQKKSESYVSAPSKDLCLIIFDIPETARKNRDWMRSILRNLDFEMLQKSVWVGKSKIPVAFLEDIAERRLMDYVHIFTISKAGSIEKMQ